VEEEHREHSALFPAAQRKLASLRKDREWAEEPEFHARSIVAPSVFGGDRDSLIFERKSALSNTGLAKSCAAFANTFGGMLVIGIADATDELTGIVQPAGEIQVWAKDVLRFLVLPLPAFRARWLSLQDRGTDGLLLVLVEESSTTPHLLTRQGAIYVRNPGSSDPVPISDQRDCLSSQPAVTLRARARQAASQSTPDRLLSPTGW
jgi:hypothetical protein